MNSLIIFLVILVSIPAFIHTTVTIYTIFYQYFYYQTYIRNHFDQNYHPPCSIIIAVKGHSPTLKKTILSLLTQKYPRYQIIFSVESPKDTAIKAIQPFIKKHPNCQLVISKKSTTCCQKNQNIISAIKKADKSEIYVFADADMTYHPQWLREMVMPLSDPSITASSTYFWPHSSSSSLGETSHNLMDLCTYTFYCFASNILRSGLLWGGSIAIRQKDFQSLDIAKYWSNLAVDDTSLSKKLKDLKHKTIMIPATLCIANHSIQNTTQSINWYTRQIMYVKYYRRRLWQYLILTLVIPYFYIYTWLFFSLFIHQPNFFFIYIPSFYVISEITIALFYTTLGPIADPLRFILLSPIVRIASFIGFAKTFFNRTIFWSGVAYQLDHEGQVSKIER